MALKLCSAFVPMRDEGPLSIRCKTCAQHKKLHTPEKQAEAKARIEAEEAREAAVEAEEIQLLLKATGNKKILFCRRGFVAKTTAKTIEGLTCKNCGQRKKLHLPKYQDKVKATFEQGKKWQHDFLEACTGGPPTAVETLEALVKQYNELCKEDVPCNANTTNAAGMNGLIVAAANGFGDAIANVFAHSDFPLSVSRTDHEGKSALHHAAEGGFCDVVAALIDLPGIDLNMKTQKGDAELTAVMIAQANGHKQIVSLLKDAGAEVPEVSGCCLLQ